MNEFEKFLEGTQWLPDEAKVAATALPPDAVMWNGRATLTNSERKIRWRDTSKPATPEPPEWKGEERDLGIVNIGGRKIRFAVSTKYYDDSKYTKPRPTPDPIAEFNERRKAKRENRSPTVTDILREALNKRSSDILARAMSTPLPHDPTIHDRLMPWRGK